MRNARLVLGIAVVLSVGCCSLLLQLRTTAVGAPERAANTAEVVARSAAFAAPTQTWEKQRVFASAVEGEDDFAHLECPTGQTIHSIDFASFGTPTRGPDGALDEDPTCHAPSSREVAAEACLHQTACQLAPSAEAFGGDPCPDKGEAKRLDLQATCGHAEQGQFAYEGCFAHNSHKLISLWTDEPTSWVDCRDLANYREATFFALEHPLTYPAGLGNCGLAGDYAGEGHIGTTSCKHGVDYNGRPLGGPRSRRAWRGGAGVWGVGGRLVAARRAGL